MHNAPLRQLSVRSEPSAQVNLVERVRGGHPTGLEELYGLANNFSFFLMRQLGRDELQDNIHDVFVTVAQAVSVGKLRDPGRLIPFITTVTRFHTYRQIEYRTKSRKFEGSLEHVNVLDANINIEQAAYDKQKIRIAREILQSMSPRDRDVLLRFYLKEQSKEQICREMKLTPTQFRLLKSKAKSNFTRLGSLRLRGAGLPPERESKGAKSVPGAPPAASIIATLTPDCKTGSVKVEVQK